MALDYIVQDDLYAGLDDHQRQSAKTEFVQTLQTGRWVESLVTVLERLIVDDVSSVTHYILLIDALRLQRRRTL